MDGVFVPAALCTSTYPDPSGPSYAPRKPRNPLKNLIVIDVTPHCDRRDPRPVPGWEGRVRGCVRACSGQAITALSSGLGGGEGSKGLRVR